MSAEIFRVKNYKSYQFFSATLFEENFDFLLMFGIFKLEHGFKNFKTMALVPENVKF